MGGRKGGGGGSRDLQGIVHTEARYQIATHAHAHTLSDTHTPTVQMICERGTDDISRTSCGGEGIEKGAF